MVDLAQWLRAQLDADEKVVQDRLCVNCGNGVAPLSGPLGVTGYTHEGLRLNDQGELERGWEGRRCQGRLTGAEPVQNPARVLREIDSKRQLLDELLPEPSEPETDAELHARFAHPAYEYRTTEGPRKQWDYADVPPSNEEGEPDPTWERNTDAGRDGWERLDYTEESYWRRRLPEGRERRPEIPRWLRLLAFPYKDRDGYREEWAP